MVLIIRSRVSAALLAACFLTFSRPACAQSPADTEAGAAILLCEDGTVLYEKNADKRSLIASTTKLMTALVCLEHTGLDETVIPKARHCAVEGSSMYLKAGESYTVRELLLGLLLSSGNDAALALAEYTAGSESAFVALMNRKAEALGLSNTHFENPHGLDAAAHYGSARDLASLMLCCMENPAFRDLNSQRSAEVKGLTLLNHNKLLSSFPGCVGGKTGYTRAAGRCLVTCCEREGLRCVCVTLSDPDDWNDHRALYDWAYGSFAIHDLGRERSFEIPVVSGSRLTVRAAPGENARVVLPKGEETACDLELPQFVFAPVEAGECAGKLTVKRADGKPVTFPLRYITGAALADPCLNPDEPEVLNP